MGTKQPKENNMRTKVINYLKKTLAEDGGFDPEYEDYTGFPMPTNDQEIEALSDEQMIELLAIYGTFLG